MKKLILLLLFALVLLSSCATRKTYELTLQDGIVMILSCDRAQIANRENGYDFRCDNSRYFVVSVSEVEDE